jgi:hypothetical protein
MSEMNRWDDMGNYTDDEVRLESYAEIAEIKPEFVEKVVQSVQMEVGADILMNPGMSIQQIKISAMQRFMDLIDKGLLSQAEADKCYQRFAYMVDYYYGTT